MEINRDLIYQYLNSIADKLTYISKDITSLEIIRNSYICVSITDSKKIINNLEIIDISEYKTWLRNNKIKQIIK